MKLKINFNFHNILDYFKKNLSIVMLAFLVLVLILVGFIIFDEIKKITQVTGAPENSGQILRVNLEKHRKLEKTLNDNSTFSPEEVDGAGAFGVAPPKSKAQ